MHYTAQEDPELFLATHKPPLLLDEVQYAPELFSYLKLAIDQDAAPGSFWLTGSQSFAMMELAQESLAGRMAIVHMSSLSQHELFGRGSLEPFTVSMDELQQRSNSSTPVGVDELYERIWQGSMPGHISGKYTDREVFYSSYIDTYINRDVTDMMPKINKLIFRDFVRAAACRTAQMLNIHDIAMDVGVSDDTAKHWLQILEKSGVIYFLRPYTNNLLKRMVKTPKLYFFDTGLVAYLTQYNSAAILANGALNGSVLENFAINEIIKSYRNVAKECFAWYFRDKSGNEIDLVLESEGQLHPLEIKRSSNPSVELLKSFSYLKKASLPVAEGGVVCLSQEFIPYSRDNFIIPVWSL